MLAGHVGAQVLGALGVERVSGVAGESFLPLLDGLRLEGIPFVNTSHESGAVFFALGQARISGVPGVAAVTRGPGASNSLIAVYEAMKSATPLILIVGQVETELRYRDGIQEMEILDTFKSTTKAGIEVTRADRVGSSLIAAYRKSLEGRPGPVVLSIPTDHLYGEASPVDVPGAVLLQKPEGGPALGDVDLDRVLDALAIAKRVLIILGRDFRHYRHSKLVALAAEAGGFGVLGAHSCQDVVEFDNPYRLGCSTVRASEHIADAIAGADVILSFGSRFGDQTTRGFTATGARMFAFSTEETAIWDEYLATEHWVADPVSALRGIHEQATPHPDVLQARRSWVAGVRARIAAERQLVFEINQGPETVGVPMSAVVDTLDALLPASSLVVSDVGTFNDWFTRYLPFNHGRRYVGPTSNPMGFALPTAIGAQTISGVDRTVVLSGDGGFLMSGMELATLKQLNLPITVLVFVNGVWGSIARDQDRTFGVRYGTEFGALPDFSALANSFGIESHPVDDVAGLGEVLSWALDRDGPSLVAVHTDPMRLSPLDIAASGRGL